MVLGSRAGCKGARTGAVGVLVRERRRSAGITQRELAAAAGVSIGALRDLEQGRTWCPRWGVLTAIADALGIDWHERAELVGAWAGGQHGDDDGSSAVPALARAGADLRAGTADRGARRDAGQPGLVTAARGARTAGPALARRGAEGRDRRGVVAGACAAQLRGGGPSIRQPAAPAPRPGAGTARKR